MMPPTRRAFCAQSAALLLTPRLVLSQSGTTHLDVAAIDHDRILQAATHALAQAPAPLTSFLAARSPGPPHDFYSEPDDYWPDPANPAGPYLVRSGAPNPAASTAHRDALFTMSGYIAALTAAFVVTKEPRYASRAVAHLRAWFVEPATSMTPNLRYAQVILPAKAGRPEGIIEGLPLAEVAKAVEFLVGSEALAGPDRTGVERWFSDYFEWLNTARMAGLARDDKSRHGSSWLLQAAAMAHLNQADDRPLTVLRHQYKSNTIRAQILADGTFPRELATPNPYRNTLFNLDMLAAVCLLLSTRFESVWDYELQDGPGMRVVIARIYPYILHRGAWPYPADASHFNDLPLRRSSLLFAARAYDRPEYAELWKALPPDTSVPELQHSLPLRQPLLWVARPRA
jgi:hypothetical protein